MKCPKCSRDNDKVIDTRPAREGASVRRRRECLECGFTFTTYEELDGGDVTVIKANGGRQPFDRAKLDLAIRRACGKRPVSDDQIRTVIDSVIAKLDGGEVPSSRIAELVMDELQKIDEVAYIRFASVYRRFTDVAQFLAAVTEIAKK